VRRGTDPREGRVCCGVVGGKWVLEAMGGIVVPGQTRRDRGGHPGGISWLAMRQNMADLFV